MDPFNSNSIKSHQSQQQTKVNPFAKALAETEQRASASTGSSAGLNSLDNNLFSPSVFSQANLDSLANSNKQNSWNNQQSPVFDALQQQQELEHQQQELKHQQMRDKLHRMINPVEQTDIFSATEEKRKKEINEVREELKNLAQEIAQFYKEIDVTLTQDVVSPGQTGVYHQSFFAKLKEFIQMLRQRISSARTWARQAQIKQRKKRYLYGLDFTNQEAKSVHDMLQHERSNAMGA